jgi:hypothetical protein
MHPVYLLAFATFVLVIGFLVWNRVSAGRHTFSGNPAGVGGPADPIAGATGELRDPDTMRKSLDMAAGDAPQRR